MATKENKKLSVYRKVQKIQRNLKAPKGQYNKFGKYKYRNAEDILEALKPLLNDYDCFINISDEIILIQDRFYVKATAKIVCSDSGESVETSAFSREALSKKGMDEGQVTGSTSSYARKYALNGLLAVDDTKDDDFSAPEVKKPSKTTAKKEEKKFEKKTEKTPVSDIGTLIDLLAGKMKLKALNQVISQRYITKEQKEDLREVLTEEELEKIEVR